MCYAFMALGGDPQSEWYRELRGMSFVAYRFLIAFLIFAD